MFSQLIKWQHKPSGMIVSAVICFVLTYLFFYLSEDRGNLLYYLITLLFLIYALKFLFRLIGTVFHGLFSR